MAVARVTETRPAADLRQSGRRAGRTGVRRRVVRAQCGPIAGACSFRLSKKVSPSPNGSARANGWRCAMGRVAQLAEARSGGLRRLRAGPARLRRQERFPGVVLGLSGGINSALVRRHGGRCARRRARALRDAALPLHVAGNRSRTRRPCAKALGVRYDMVPIARAVEGFEAALSRCSTALPRDVTEENLQARARGVMLMAISNKFGADGGDHRQQVGNVGRLCHALWRHERRLQSDQGSLQDRGLSPGAAAQPLEAGRCAGAGRHGDPGEHHDAARRRAELRENQKDQDTLPPYDVLDAILERLVEREEPVADDRRSTVSIARP